MAVLLTLDDDSLALVSGTRYNAAGYDVRLEVLGSQDSICAGLDGRLPLRSAEPGAAFPPGPPYPMFIDRFAGAYQVGPAAFVSLATDGGPSPGTVRDALEASYVAEACETSRALHRPVQLAEVRR
jgi:myo-inositol 2-dehydrogenase / D-chiro-inositol 1-dehydrogenase